MGDVTYLVPAGAVGSQLTFTQGLLVGQLSIVILAALFVRYFIFQDVTTALEKERQTVRISSRISMAGHTACLTLCCFPPASPSL